MSNDANEITTLSDKISEIGRNSVGTTGFGAAVGVLSVCVLTAIILGSVSLNESNSGATQNINKITANFEIGDLTDTGVSVNLVGSKYQVSLDYSQGVTNSFLNLLQGVTPGVVQANRVLTLDTNMGVSGISTLRSKVLYGQLGDGSGSGACPAYISGLSVTNGSYLDGILISGDTTTNSVTGTNSAIVGGESNTVSSNYSGNLAGQQNTIAAGASWSVIVGGVSNQAYDSMSFVAGGFNNSVSGVSSAIIGGHDNTVTASHSGNLAGNANQVTNYGSGNVAGASNIVSGIASGNVAGQSNGVSGTYSGNVAGTQNGVSGNYSGNVAGNHNQVNGNFSGNVAGAYNGVSGTESGNVAGNHNQVNGNYSGNVAGAYNGVSGTESGNVAGTQNGVSGNYSGNVAGAYNGVSGNYSGNVAGAYNTVSGQESGNLAGESNVVSGPGSGNIGGQSNNVGGSYSGNVAGISNVVNSDHTVTLGGKGLSTQTGSSWDYSALVGSYNNYSTYPWSESVPQTLTGTCYRFIVGSGSASAGNNAFVVDDVGNLYYGTSAGASIYQRTGQNEYTAKSFTIQHPTINNRWLRHGCLEGPEGGVYYRGKGEAPTTIQLPDYATHIASDFTVQVTPIGSPRMMSASEVSPEGTFRVYGEGKFHWNAIGERVALDPEPLKTDVTIHSVGPYSWSV